MFQIDGNGRQGWEDRLATKRIGKMTYKIRGKNWNTKKIFKQAKQ